MASVFFIWQVLWKGNTIIFLFVNTDLHFLIWHVCNYPNVFPFQIAVCCLFAAAFGFLTICHLKVVNSPVPFMQAMIMLFF